MALLGMPLGAVQAGQLAQPQQAPPPSFIWGQGGRRMTADDIELQRKLAAQQMAEGSDYSPVGHWTQGLARMSQGLLGGWQNRRADKASDANMAESDHYRGALSDPNAGVDIIAEALVNPYVSDDVRGLAKMAYERANPKPAAPTSFMQEAEASGLLPGTPEYQKAMRDRVQSIVDPDVIIPTPTGTYFGPRSGFGATLGGGDPVSGVGTSVPTAPVGRITPIEPTMSNTQAPQLMDNGFPQAMTPQQYQVVVGQLGEPATQAWMKRNNIRISQ